MEPLRIPFDPEKVKRIKACLDEGKPIQPGEPGNWTFDDFLILAGCAAAWCGSAWPPTSASGRRRPGCT
jgi:hypothetical protein